jgi:hypothetical protein
MRLGNLEKTNLREVWAREDTHFTQWLAKEENISVLLDENWSVSRKYQNRR